MVFIAANYLNQQHRCRITSHHRHRIAHGLHQRQRVLLRLRSANALLTRFNFVPMRTCNLMSGFVARHPLTHFQFRTTALLQTDDPGSIPGIHYHYNKIAIYNHLAIFVHQNLAARVEIYFYFLFLHQFFLLLLQPLHLLQR